MCDHLPLSQDGPLRPKSVYEDGHDHIVDVPPYALMIKFIGHYETHVDMFFHYGTTLDFILIVTPLLFCFPS
jgi:hypothetical protein